MDRILAKIKEKGHWYVKFSPNQFTEDRIQLKTCEEIVKACTVEISGWIFPHLGRADGLSKGSDWIQGELDIDSR